ncbi:ornithine carbamoyltransferase [Streptomyces solicathayae]|uniref:Ornithine carbamoyltransferase n=1 Tax=Streptomyces solicathayae TaxID=3081768 RepID=A0ABZ0M231_9ACTN|nr:ornithine carbamoyltransferase [Streptomyces sp. HUAS YS2]WOX25823.1 ornithine carbamoyltransferase [Streptomyces sp. HUAS YS2]
MMSTETRGLLTLSELTREELQGLVARSREFFLDRTAHDRPLRDKLVGVLFAKTSTRTRTAFTSGVVRLGGFPVTYGPNDLQTATGESIRDTGRIFGSMLDALVARTSGPLEELREMAGAGRLPVINAMAAEEHPTQGVCDLATMLLQFGSLDGISVLYLGEGNNTASALAHGISHLPRCHVTFATPAGYGLDPQVLDTAAKRAAESGGSVREVHDMDDLPKDVDVVYTTRWQTTGTVKADPDWRERFRPFHIDERLLGRWPEAVFMHDLPAHRGEEVSGAVLDGPRSIAWKQAEMKLTSAMAVLEWVAAGNEPQTERS